MKAKQKTVEKGFDNNKDIQQHEQQPEKNNIAKARKTKVSQNKNEPRTETFRKKIPPSENPDPQTDGNTFKHDDVIDMEVIRPVDSAKNNNNYIDYNNRNNNNNMNTNTFYGYNNNNNFISSEHANKIKSTAAGMVNDGYNESGLSGSPQINKAAATLDEFDMMFDEGEGGSEILENLNDGRSTRRSAGSNNSTIIKVSNDVENAVKSSATEVTNRNTNHSIVDELNQTATSIRHVQLNENSHRRGGSTSSGGEEWNTTNGNPYWNEETSASAISNLDNNKPPFVDTQRFFRN